MAERLHPDDIIDARNRPHGLDRKRRPLARILYAALIANAALWCAAQLYLTVDYVQQRAAIVEGR